MDEEQVPSDLSQLSNQEKDILRLIAAGKSITEAAEILQLHGNEVLACRHAIMERFGIHSIAGLTKFAIGCGLQEP